MNRMKTAMKTLSLLLAVFMIIGSISMPVCAYEGSGTIFVAFGCRPGYEGSAEITLTETDTGEQYTVVVSQENGWGVDVQVTPGTYTAEAAVLSGDDGDICWIDENERSVASGEVNSFAGVIGEERDVMDRASIIQLAAIGEDGRQMFYGEMEVEDVEAAIRQMQYTSQEQHNDGGEDDDTAGHYITPENKPAEGPENEEPQNEPVTDPTENEEPEWNTRLIILAAAGAVGIAAVIVYVVRSKRR